MIVNIWYIDTYMQQVILLHRVDIGIVQPCIIAIPKVIVSVHDPCM